MGIESEIISYLEIYGNTREKDLIDYGMHNFNNSASHIKKIVDRMAVKGKIHRIVHNKLTPPEVYISLEESLPPEIMIENKIVDEDVSRILEEAASVAEQNVKEYPEDSEDGDDSY